MKTILLVAILSCSFISAAALAQVVESSKSTLTNEQKSARKDAMEKLMNGNKAEKAEIESKLKNRDFRKKLGLKD